MKAAVSRDPLRRCFSEARLGALSLRNRLIKSATFEGKSTGGLVSPELVRLHERIAEGGVAMTTLAYCAAEADGRIHENMLYMHEGIREPIGELARRVHAAGAKLSGELGHCGSFSKNRELEGRRPLGPSRGVNAMGLAHGLPFAGALTKAQIRERVEVFGRAAGRKDEYGGPLRNRMRFGLEVLARVRDVVGEGFPLLAKISMSDGVRGGTSYDDGMEIAALLEKGGVPAAGA
jgi:2,4-dienoyl-CoA reductase-like NADH-dependent reductase (Old Yellow Enzyme family)